MEALYEGVEVTPPRKLTGVDMEVVTSVGEMPPEEFVPLQRMLQRLAIDQIERVSCWDIANPVGFVRVRGARWLVDVIDRILAAPQSLSDMRAGRFAHDGMVKKVEAALPAILGDEQVAALDSLALLMDMRIAELPADDQLVDAFVAAMESYTPDQATGTELDRLAQLVTARKR